MKKNLLVLMFFTGMLSASASSHPTNDGISILSKSNNVNGLVQVVPKSLLKKRTVKLMNLMNEAGNQALDKMDEKTTRKWNLESIEIGPGVAGEIGIGPWSVGASAGFKLYFERN